jgi:hypothetical protein
LLLPWQEHYEKIKGAWALACEGAMKVIDAETGESFSLYPSEELQNDLKIHHNAGLCVHAQLDIRKVTVAGGGVQYRQQCQECGDLIGFAIAHTKAPQDAAVENQTLRVMYRSERDRQYAAIIQRHVKLQKNKDTEFWHRYNEYLKSPTWAERRGRVLQRAKGICEGCSDRPAVQVHHLTYKHVFEEFLFELVAVCDDCHKRLHGNDNVDDAHIEPPCAACRWQSENEDRHWCGKFDIAAAEAMSSEGPCGPKQTELEPLK